GKGKGKNISKALPMTVTADSFKHKKAIKNPTLRKLNNKLAGELLLLRLNIIASDNGFTTPANQSEKFGDLFYEEPTDTGTPYYGKELREISAYFDSILTYGKRLTNVNYSQLASVAEKLNTAFASPDTITLNDTVSLYVGGFKLKGFKMMSEVPYLRRDLGIPPRAHSSAIIKDETPSVFSLEQNYPNPFNPNTTIRFSLPLDASVSLRVFDILGREVSSILQNEELEEGEYEFDFDATKLSSGVYFYKLSADNGKFNSIRRMLLLK
ncbi:MAG: T9SS type A sorting domain-containing protein, partial [Ignavibacteriales bacterium]|nr:T9SS type A sorting domain-containing protein [Ignavibacteriales bacterium]